MKKFVLLITLVFSLITSFAAFPTAKHEESAVAELTSPGYNANIEAIERMSIKDYEKLTGKKMSFINRIFFGLERKYLINQLKKGEGNGEFKLLGFLPALLFGPFGFLAVLLVFNDPNYRRSAWLGFRIWLLVCLVLLLVLLAKAGGKFK